MLLPLNRHYCPKTNHFHLNVTYYHLKTSLLPKNTLYPKKNIIVKKKNYPIFFLPQIWWFSPQIGTTVGALSPQPQFQGFFSTNCYQFHSALFCFLSAPIPGFSSPKLQFFSPNRYQFRAELFPLSPPHPKSGVFLPQTWVLPQIGTNFNLLCSLFPLSAPQPKFRVVFFPKTGIFHPKSVPISSHSVLRSRSDLRFSPPNLYILVRNQVV